MKSLSKYFFSYSLFYFALRMWNRHFGFLPVIEDNSTLIAILMFFITSILLYINLTLKDEGRNKYYVHICFMLFLVVSNILYWNGYAYLMRPHLEYLNLLDPYLLGHLVPGFIGVSASFLLMKVLRTFYEKYRYRT